MDIKCFLSIGGMQNARQTSSSEKSSTYCLLAAEKSENSEESSLTEVCNYIWNFPISQQPIRGFRISRRPPEFRRPLELLRPATFRLVTGKILYTKVQANQHDVCYVPIGIQAKHHLFWKINKINNT
jgi:hypothetical protein